MKVCGSCKESKSFSDFSKKSSSRDGHSSKCKKCHNEYVRTRWYPENKQRHIESVSVYKSSNKHKVLANRHLVPEDEVVLALAGPQCCEVCSSVDDLCLDHCHSTLKVRGILCRRCNAAIGMLGDCLEEVQVKLPMILKYLSK